VPGRKQFYTYPVADVTPEKRLEHRAFQGLSVINDLPTPCQVVRTFSDTNASRERPSLSKIGPAYIFKQIRDGK
jgi:hypothetical protein